MGLGAQKRRNKLSHDPNNTSWSKSTGNFGHKILSAQGWKPGDYLGATNADHSDHYTAANASHIRVLLREENLGLGAEIGKGNAETFGLSLFSGVLGRLNGKSDTEVQKQQGALRDAALKTYQAQKYGLLGFVSGGFLVGDKIQSALDGSISGSKKRSAAFTTPVEERKAKKQRAEESKSQRKKSQASTTRRKTLVEEGPRQHSVENEVESRKPSKRSTSSRASQEQMQTLEQDSPATGATGFGKLQRKSDKRQSPQAHDDQEDTSRRGVESSETPPRKSKKKTERTKVSKAESTEDERRRRRDIKRAHKEDRRRRKEEKRSNSESHPTDDIGGQQGLGGSSAQPQDAATKQSVATSNRHNVRQRYIQQKRMASMNPQAMKEIFMLKAAA